MTLIISNLKPTQLCQWEHA